MTLTVPAYAKLNLGLEVLGRRPDGYHEIRTILCAISLHDSLTFRPAAELGVRWPPGQLPPQPDLIRQAAEALRQHCDVRLGARITLTKRIPMGTGLGGGSADAAATLLGLNRLWDLGIPRPRLRDIAAELGSDIPFFLGRSPALGAGRGEDLTRLPQPKRLWAVVVCSAVGFDQKTKRMYAALRPEHYSDGGHVERLASALSELARPSGLEPGNAFECVADALFDGWAGLRDDIQRRTGRPFYLTGAGPALYTLAPSRLDALGIKQSLGRIAGHAFVVHSVVGPPRPRALA